MLPILLHIATGPYRFSWHVHADVVLLCVSLQAAYLYAVTQLRGMVSDAGRVKRRQVWFFSAGVLAVYAVSGTPIHEISEQYLFSAHMLQHTVYTLVAAPLLLAGIPAWMWEALLRQRGVMPVARKLAHPVVAFGLFNAVLALTHLPGVVDYSLNHHWFHLLVHVTLVATGMLTWWPILSVVPSLPRLTAPLQMAYLFLQSLLPTVIAAFVTFADSTVYSFYDRAPRMWGLSPESDQQVAGGIMKLLGSLIIWSFIAVAFFQWYNREQTQNQEPRLDDVEHELQAMGLTPGARDR